MNSCVNYMVSVALAVMLLKNHKIKSQHSLVMAGRHNCLWCLITSSDLKKPLADRQRSMNPTPLRTLDSLRSDHQSFMSAGGILNDAKEHNNVIGELFFDIPIENVWHGP